MKLDEISKQIPYNFHNIANDPQQIQQLLQAISAHSGNLYQELEMSSRYVNPHRDTSYPNQNVSLHSHAFYELLYCRTDSNVEYLVGAERYRLQKGDIVFIPPGISHRPLLPENTEELYVRDVLWISTEFINTLEGELSSPLSFPKNQYSLIRTANTRWEFLEVLFQLGVREEEQRRANWETAVLGNTTLILSYLQRAYTEHTAEPMYAEKPQLLDRITDYIENHYAQHITIKDLARQFYISDSSISHLFKQRMGVSIYHYITQRRLIGAKNLIQQSVPLEHIAPRVGFSDYSSFYRAFKQEYGISPRQYRNLQDGKNT